MPRPATAFALLVTLAAVAVAIAAGAVWVETDAREALDDAFSRPVGSARLEARIDAWIDREAGPRRSLRARVDGPVRATGTPWGPDLDWRFEAETPQSRHRGRLVSAGGRARVTWEAGAYEVPPGAVEGLTAALLGPPAAGGPSKPRRWLYDVSGGGEASVDGVPTDRHRARLRTDLLLDDLAAATAVTGLAPPPPADRRALAFVLRGSTAEVHVGREDGVVRRVDARGRFGVPPARRAQAGGVSGGGFALSLVLRRAGNR